ncbi:MAG: hypothetical protein ABWX67_11805 [Allosphingosinicella sp.]
MTEVNPGKAMSKRNSAALAGALSMLLLAACDRSGPAPAENAAAGPEANRLEATSPARPAPPGASANESAGPPPDAVSHPDGYLPPAPAEPAEPAEANASGADPSAPATEDEYLRNRQTGR